MNKFIKFALMAFAGLLLFPAFSNPGAVGSLSLKVEADKNVFPSGQEQNGIIRITISAPELKKTVEKPRTFVNLAVVLDRSGSMSGKKIENAKEAAIAAVNMLSEGDIFSLVTYDNQVNTIVPAVFVDDKSSIIAKIKGISSGGNTALFAGVSAGAGEIRKNLSNKYINRIILLSDGIANVGPSSPDELGRLGASLLKEGISVSTVGVGNDYNEDLMTALSQNSDGNFYFVENSNDLPLIFSKELGSALDVAAKTVNIHIECSENVSPLGIIGHDCRINGSTIDLFFNQLYSGNTKTLLLQVGIPPKNPEENLKLASVSVKYNDPQSNSELSTNGSASVSFSGEKKVVEESVNIEVVEDYAIMQNAVLKDEAVKKADSGKMKEASSLMRQSADNLKKVSKLRNNVELEKEAEQAEQQADEIEQQAEAGKDKLDSDDRKQLKGEKYQTINSQKFKQKK